MTDRAWRGAEWNAAELFDEYEIPDNLRDGLERYLKQGIRPGGFLCAVISNDLREAVLRAHDAPTYLAIERIVRLLCYEASDTAHGSPARLEAWIEDAKRRTRGSE